MKLFNRRHWLQGAACAATLASVPIAARAQPRALRALGAFALLGDSVALTVAGVPTDSRMDRFERRNLEVPQIGFDLVALRGVKAVVEAGASGSAPRLWMFRAPTPMNFEAQRAVTEGARRAELPAWIVQAINQERLSHVLLITRTRGQAAFPVREGFTLGRGLLEGIGYHLDPTQRIANPDNAAGSSLLGAHALIELAWLDAITGDLLSAREISDQRLVAPQPGSDPNDPWSQIRPAERAEILRSVLQEAAERGVRESWPQR